MTTTENTAHAENTDRELWREREGDYYADSIHVTKGGGIGMNVGGRVIVMPLKDWHALAALTSRPTPTDEEWAAVSEWVPSNLQDTIDALLVAARSDWNTNLAIRPTLLSAAKLLEDSHPAPTELTDEQLQRAAHIVFEKVNYATASHNFPPDSGYINAVKAMLEMFRLSIPEEAEAVINLPQGHDEPCFYCGEPCEAFAGDPGRWPLGFCQPDGTGITRWHHTRCVTARLFPTPAAEVTGGACL